MSYKFAPVVGFEGIYEVCENGDIFCLPRVTVQGIQLERRKLNPYENNKGYMCVSLYLDGVGKRMLVHRVVAEAFIKNEHNFPIINHKDENPHNNNVENLEWCTYTYNNNYGTIKERSAKTRGIPVIAIKVSTGWCNTYVSTREACRELGLKQSKVQECLDPKATGHHTCKGYRFELVE